MSSLLSMTIFTEIMTGVSQTVNEIFGELCALYVADPYAEEAPILLPSIYVILDRNRELKGEFNNLVGYQTAVKILRSNLANPPRGEDCYIRTLDGEVYKLGKMVEANKTAFWLKATVTSDAFPATLPNLAPVASFTFTLPTRTSVAFNDTSTDVDGIVVDWVWNFGDGATSVLQNPTHDYINDGVYITTLTVTDDLGLTGNTDYTFTISPISLDDSIGELFDIIELFNESELHS